MQSALGIGQCEIECTHYTCEAMNIIVNQDNDDLEEKMFSADVTLRCGGVSFSKHS